MSWDVLNDGDPILSSEEGTKGLRDPFIMRSAEGDRFFMIATDLSIGSGTSWDEALDDGSAYLEIWESTYLRNWGNQRHVEVSGPFASMTWAPEAYWDDERGEYVVYWSSRIYLDGSRPYDKTATPHHTYSKVMYSTTRDFVNFSPARVWQDAGDRIDTTMIKDDGVFYRFTKEVTGCEDILQESSESMLDPTVVGDYASWKTDVSCLSKEARDTSRTTEGPTIFKANPGDVSLPDGSDGGFYLFVDDFTGAGYLPLFSESLADPSWQTVPGSLPHSRHGSVMPVTLNQWEDAKGEELSLVATDTEFVDLESGDTVDPGDTVTVRVSAADAGEVAGEVEFIFDDFTASAPVEQVGEEYQASIQIPQDAAAGTTSLIAQFQAEAPLADSESSEIELVIAGDTGGDEDGGDQDGDDQDGTGQDGDDQDGTGQDGEDQDGNGQDGTDQDGEDQDGDDQDGADEDGAAEDGSGQDGDDQSGDGSDSDTDDDGVVDPDADESDSDDAGKALPRTGAELLLYVVIGLVAIGGGIGFVSIRKAKKQSN